MFQFIQYLRLKFSYKVHKEGQERRWNRERGFLRIMLSLPVIDAFAAMIAIFFSQTVLLLVGGDEKFLRARNLG